MQARANKAKKKFVSARLYNELVEHVNWLLVNAVISGGQGLSTVPLPKGRSVVVTGQQGNIDDPLILTFDPIGAPAEDTWSRVDDRRAVEKIEIWGVKYDDDTHRLQIKTRTTLVDSLGAEYSTSEESDWIDVVQFVPHPT